jgi:YfiH family protein
VHGDHIVEVNDKKLKEAGEADGMLTRESGIHLGVLTADCVPILFVAPKRRLVAAVHAGWRGTLAGIAAKMVRQLEEKDGAAPGEIEAALGPAIGPCCYEVGEEVATPFLEKWRAIARAAIHEKNGKYFVDLRQINHAILERAGVPPSKIFGVGPCTSCAPADFYSYRREKRETGRQLSFIGWLS